MSRVVIHQAELSQLLYSPSGAVAKDISRRAIQVQTAAKRSVPVDTGRLRSSISWHLRIGLGGLYAEVGSDVSYAIYLEMGTRFIRGRAFLRNALVAAAA